MRTTIGVMARPPVPGRCKTRLLSNYGADWVAGLYEAMLRDTLDGLLWVPAVEHVVFAAPLSGTEDVASRVAQSVEVLQRHAPAPWSVLPQAGEDLGARMENALETLFARAATRDGGDVPTCALLVGSDAPSIPTEPIAEALALMDGRPELLLGPSVDGGYYLIGMTRMSPAVLRDMPWSTDELMRATRAKCKELDLPIRELETWYDVDEPADVDRLVDEMKRHPERAPRTAQFLITHP